MADKEGGTASEVDVKKADEVVAEAKEVLKGDS
jgi:hypothetical protein